VVSHDALVADVDFGASDDDDNDDDDDDDEEGKERSWRR